MAIDTIFKNIADAIREKAGTSGLITPAQMPQAIADIPTGGGGLVAEEPLYFDSHIGYVTEGSFTKEYSDDYNTDIYYLTENHYYILLKMARSNRFRPILLPINPVEATSTIINGYDICSRWNSLQETQCILAPAQQAGPGGFYSNLIRRPPVSYSAINYPYLAITKSNNGTAGVKTYLFDVTSLT